MFFERGCRGATLLGFWVSLLSAGSAGSAHALATDKPAANPIPVEVQEMTDAPQSVFPCPPQRDLREEAYEVGLNYGALFPSGLVGTDTTLPTLGVVLGAPLLGHTLQAQINYGSSTAVRVFVVEADMRWTFDSPYLASYFLTGAHYLLQESDTSSVSDRGEFGLTAGIGLAFGLGSQLEAHFDLRGYIENRTTVLAGGGFSILL